MPTLKDKFGIKATTVCDVQYWGGTFPSLYVEFEGEREVLPLIEDFANILKEEHSGVEVIGPRWVGDTIHGYRYDIFSDVGLKAEIFGGQKSTDCRICAFKGIDEGFLKRYQQRLEGR
jgi:hypothetical protein